MPLLSLAAAATVFHIHFKTPPFTDDFNDCRIVVVTLTVVTKFDASGAIFQPGEIRGTFTSSASGKSIVFQNSATEKTTAPIDNGDGTSPSSPMAPE